MDKLESTLPRDDLMTARLPPGLIGACLVFWGIATDHFTISIALCVLAEAGKLTTYRWNLSSKHFQNIADLTSVLFAVVAIYQFTQQAFHGIYGILALLPLCLFPLIFAQRIASQQLFPMSALFLSLRRKIAAGTAEEQWISAEFLYGFCCILSASVNQFESNAYLYGSLLTSCTLLFFARTTRPSMHAWGIALVGVSALSLVFLSAIETVYREAEDAMGYWFRQFTWSYTNPQKASTSLGQLGRLKLSDRIVIRVKAPLSIPLPLYLHEASYTTFNLGTWLASDAKMTTVDPLPSQTTWELTEASAENLRELEITTRHLEDLSVQALPIGTFRVDSPEIIELQKNPLGSIMLEAIPGQLRYRVNYAESIADSERPSDDKQPPKDLAVPADYHQVLDPIVEQLGLSRLPPAEAITRLSEYFSANFRYSLVGKRDYPGKKPLASFLSRDRSGHCEYFATATTLLLRRAGIPTRYSVGYVVDEYSPMENAFIARARHAHAWTSAYIDGHWQTVDTTPGNWAALENAEASAWQAFSDIISWLELRFKRLQRLDRSEFNRRAIWAVPVLTLFLLWRLRNRITHDTPQKPAKTVGHRHIESGDLRQLLNKLRDAGYTIRPGATATSILREYLATSPGLPPADRLVALHYIKRFSTRTLTPQEQQELDTGVALHLDALATKPES